MWGTLLRSFTRIYLVHTQLLYQVVYHPVGKSCLSVSICYTYTSAVGCCCCVPSSFRCLCWIASTNGCASSDDARIYIFFVLSYILFWNKKKKRQRFAKLSINHSNGRTHRWRMIRVMIPLIMPRTHTHVFEYEYERYHASHRTGVRSIFKWLLTWIFITQGASPVAPVD